MGFYEAMRLVGRVIRHQCIRETVVGWRPEGQIPPGVILAVTHISHLEPFLVSVHFQRRIHWLARIEFWRVPAFAMFLRGVEALCVNRQGRSVSAIRKSIELLRAGKTVGIFPEGGVVKGGDSVLRAGPIKGGAAMLALRSGAPILPVVLLNTQTLNCVEPWLPFRRARLMTAFGNLIHPPPDYPSPCLTRRQTRNQLSLQVTEEFIRTYRELLIHCNMKDTDVP